MGRAKGARERSVTREASWKEKGEQGDVLQEEVKDGKAEAVCAETKFANWVLFHLQLPCQKTTCRTVQG